MKVSDSHIFYLINKIITKAENPDVSMTELSNDVKDWLSEVEAEQNRRIADELLEMGIPSFLKEQNQ